MPGFTIAHFTDAHLPLHDSFAPRELLGKRGLSALNWARRRSRLHLRAVAEALRDDILAHRPDHVAMTGDAANFGLPREFAAAASWLSGFGPPATLSFVPGNHEAISPHAEAAREAAYAPFTRGEQPEGAWPMLRRFGHVALFGVSTAIPTAPFLAQGEAGAAQIRALRSALDAAAGLCRIVLIHHPPTELASPRKALRDRAALSAALAEAGAALVLHGHDHRNELSWIEGAAGRIPVLGCPSASTPPGRGAAPAEWRFMRIRENEAGWRIEILRRALGPAGFADRGRFTLTSPR